jgi:signal transduction histidine kinase
VDRIDQDPDAISDEAARFAAELIDRISHDLRTPLGSMLIWLKLLRQAPAGAEASSALDMLERSAADQVAQLDALADTRRALSGGLRLESEPVDLAEIARVAAEALREDAEGRGVSIALLPSPRLQRVMADPRRLRQALDQLLGSLVREAPRGASIELRVDAAEGSVQCAITIRRPEHAVTPGPPSRSFGLHAKLARRLIELQGGRVERGNAPDAAVTLRFPPID